MPPPSQEYFAFSSDSPRTFCCDDAISGYKPMLPSTHPLNDFMADVQSISQPRPKKPQLSLAKQVNWRALPVTNKLPPKVLNNHEEGVVGKCIVLIEYYPQSRDQKNRPVLPTLATGGPYYARQGQRVWIGRAYPALNEQDDGEKFVNEGIEADELKAGDAQPLLWDWQQATCDEVVEATTAILGTVNTAFISDGVQRQTWECGKCPEWEVSVKKEIVQRPMKKWTFVVHYKDVGIGMVGA